ncbi:hypothetical protein PoB_001890900 [Plakobranchus ocellatus]|uniref:Uncharacterized protein n=1 Tax=Plakobranchus ocellatus TaxID=259542 RepID=A0AAV3ZDE0_9GAST|nr:hypothetical protein PoB_001890900 [Plakobranchus ocellatus]
MDASMLPTRVYVGSTIYRLEISDIYIVSSSKRAQKFSLALQFTIWRFLAFIQSLLRSIHCIPEIMMFFLEPRAPNQIHSKVITKSFGPSVRPGHRWRGSSLRQRADADLRANLPSTVPQRPRNHLYLSAIFTALNNSATPTKTSDSATHATASNSASHAVDSDNATPATWPHKLLSFTHVTASYSATHAITRNNTTSATTSNSAISADTSDSATLATLSNVSCYICNSLFKLILPTMQSFTRSAINIPGDNHRMQQI